MSFSSREQGSVGVNQVRTHTWEPSIACTFLHECGQACKRGMNGGAGADLWNGRYPEASRTPDFEGIQFVTCR
jgi:hypothetical protein